MLGADEGSIPSPNHYFQVLILFIGKQDGSDGFVCVKPENKRFYYLDF